MIIDGREIAKKIVRKLERRKNVKKFLAVFLIGKEKSSISFINQKRKIAEKLNVDFRIYKFEKKIKQNELKKKIIKVGENKKCGGIIVQLPLPTHINKYCILNAIKKEKDVDVLSKDSLCLFYTNCNLILPPAIEVLKEILKIKKIKIRSCKIAIVGVGFLIGKPIFIWLSERCPNLILLDKGGDFTLLQKADVVICGVGSSGVIKSNMLKIGALVVDFGYSMKNKKIVGDFEYNQNMKFEIDFTPTPGGTGPILIAKIFENFYLLNK